MGIKKKLFEMLIGHDVKHEYLDAARERYEQIVERYGADDFPSDKEIIHSHVSSPYKAPNVFKVKTRMLITKDFVLENIRGDLKSLTFLDVGGSSGIFFDLLGVSKSTAFAVNVLGEHVHSVTRAGYRGIWVEDEKLPFKDNSFDYCFSFQCLEHTLAPTIHIREMKRIARKGILVSIPYREKTAVVDKRESSSTFDQHVFEFSPHDLGKIGRHCGLEIRNSTTFHLEAGSSNPIKRLYRNRMGWGKPSVFLAYFERFTL
jgi:SAM-dependent methyltransferase